jgi:hypothetical protein
VVDTYKIGWRRALGGLLVVAVVAAGVSAAACAGAEASLASRAGLNQPAGRPPAAAGAFGIIGAEGDSARVLLEVSPAASETAVTLAQEPAPALYPQLIVVTALPRVALPVRATLVLPYADALVRDWRIEDETQLGVFERDAGETWRWSPALVNPATNTVVLQVDTLAAWTVGPSWMMKPWQQRSILGAEFVGGERNVLVLHGWNGEPWEACQLDLMAGIAPYYDNVAAVAYPSALDIADNANWLREEIERQWPDTPVDIIAFSEGGLVARAAIEPHTWNGDAVISAKIGRLVTIATPHLGVVGEMTLSLLNDTAARQMRSGSDFLDELNAEARHEHIRYQFIAGDLGRGSDSIVPRDSALARGAVQADGTTVLPLAHSPSSEMRRGMPCDSSVYEAVAAWQ